MIQRKQTVFLLLACAAAVVCLCLPLGSLELAGMGKEPVLYNLASIDGNGAFNFRYCALSVLLSLSGLLSLVTIFLYKNRKLQMKLCKGNLVLLVLWYALLTYIIYANENFHQAIAACLPFVSAVFVWLAHRGILSDERLVRAADRIR